MTSYVVMTAPGRAGPDGPEAEFVRDRFSVFAIPVPWLWLLYYRLWVEAAVAFAASMVLAALGELAGYGVAGALLTLLVSIYVAIEGPALRIAALRRRGYAEWGVVEADSIDDAEAKFIVEAEASFEQVEAPAPAAAAPPPAWRPQPAHAQSSHGPGLLLNPGNR